MIQVEHVDFIAQPVGDLSRAAEFYGGVLGLKRNPESGDRWIEFETGNLTIGLSTFGPGIAFRVDDVEAARSTLESEGVEFSMDTFDSGVCHGAPFTDRDENRVLIHRRYAPAEPFDVPPAEVQRTDFVGVSVTDRARAGEFYGGTLGLARNERSTDEWPEFEADNVGVILSTPEQRHEPEHRPSVYSLAFRVADVGATLERLQAEGVELPFGTEPYDSGVCHMGFFADPDGNPLIVHHRYAPYPDGSAPQNVHARTFFEPVGDFRRTRERSPHVLMVGAAESAPQMQVEQVDFITIPTRDVARAMAWYSRVFALPESAHNEGELETPNVTLGFWNPEQENLEFQPNSAGFALRVDDVDAAVEEAQAAGAQVIGVHDSGVCHMGFVKDLDGNVLILHRRYAPVTPRGQS